MAYYEDNERRAGGAKDFFDGTNSKRTPPFYRSFDLESLLRTLRAGDLSYYYDDDNEDEEEEEDAYYIYFEGKCTNILASRSVALGGSLLH